MKRRPLVGVAVAVVGGMLAAASGLFSNFVLTTAAGLALLYSFIRIRTSKSSLLLFVSVALVAACRYNVALPENKIGSMIPAGDLVESIVVVDESPRFYPSGTGGHGFAVIPVVCEGIRGTNGWQRLGGTLDLCVDEAERDALPLQGDRIRVAGRVKPKDFPGKSRHEMTFSGLSSITYLPSSRWLLPLKWGHAWRTSASKRLEVGLENFPQQRAVLKALVLGYREDIPRDCIDLFRRTGSMHIFAISGLHVGIIGLLLAIALRSLGIPRDRFALWLLQVYIAYNQEESDPSSLKGINAKWLVYHSAHHNTCRIVLFLP